MSESEKNSADEKTGDASAADTTEERPEETAEAPSDADAADAPRKEIGGRGGPDPTRYGDWEINGRCVDF